MQLPKAQWIRLAGIVSFAFLLAGCASRGHRESRGIKLSQAMEASATGNQQDLGGSRSHHHYSHDNEPADSDGSTAGAWFGASYDESEYTWQVPVDVRYTVPFDNDIKGLTHVTLTPLSFEDEEDYFGFYLGGATVDLRSGSQADRGTKDLWLFEAGLAYRHYLNSSRPAFSPYVAANIGYQLLGWGYRTPITADGETITWDAVNGVDGSLAFGVSTRRDSHLSAFGEIGVGATGFFGTTSQGFDNDVFNTFGYLSVKAGLNLKF